MENKLDLSHTIVCCPPPAPLSPLSPPPPYPPLSSLPAPPNSNHTIIPHHPRKCTPHLKSNFFMIKSLSLFFLRFSKKNVKADQQTDRHTVKAQ